ncbi:MAG: hypothetical protein Q4G59_08910 [Planctomycetia bacterium]|nr:hypothetical protein [Planctomycetia bacterium]
MNKQERILSILVQRNDISPMEIRTLAQIFTTNGVLPVVGLELQSEQYKLYKLLCRNKSGDKKEREE